MSGETRMPENIIASGEQLNELYATDYFVEKFLYRLPSGKNILATEIEVVGVVGRESDAEEE